MRKLAFSTAGLTIAAVALAVALPGGAAQRTPEFAFAPLEAPAARYVLEPTHASLNWRIRHMGLSNYTARFTRMNATLYFDPARPERIRLEATVDPGSVETDYPGTDKDWTGELATSERFFNAGRFPQARFVSRRVELTGPRTARVTGDLTFLGVTQPLVLDAVFNGSLREHPHAKQPALGFSAHGVMKRSAWGLTYGIGDDLVDEVELIMEAEFVRQPGGNGDAR